MQSGYVDRDNNRYGAIKDMIGPQDEINKRRSKALHLLTMRQVVAEQGAVEDVDAARAEGRATSIALIGFTAMGGAIGSGGLGDLAFRDGYQRSHTDVALVTVVLLLVLVQLLQMLGDRLVRHYTRR